MIMGKPITGRTVLFSMLGFFAVIFAVNGTFMYFAISSFPGLSTDGAYEKGLAYNQTLANAAKQTEIGWESHVALSQQGDLVVQITNRQGFGAGGLEVEAVLMRPAQEKLDQTRVLEEKSPGQYAAQLAPLLEGKWHVQISARSEGHAVFYKVHSVMIGE